MEKIPTKEFVLHTTYSIYDTHYGQHAWRYEAELRKTTSIGIKAAQTNYYADEQARRIGLPVNFSVTINFKGLGIAPEDIEAVFAKIRNQRFAQWVRRPKKGTGKSAPPTYYYGFENKEGSVVHNDVGNGLPHNIHVHWSVHVPEGREREFTAEMRRWIDEACGAIDWQENSLMIQPVTHGNPARYLNKGARPDIAQRYAALGVISAQGAVLGVRSRTSRNLGPTQRRRVDAMKGIDRRMRIPRNTSFQEAAPPR